MKPDSHSNRVLITGAEGFTGWHLKSHLTQAGYRVTGLTCDLTDREAVFNEVSLVSPDFVLHFAAISFAAESNVDLIYRVNVAGAINLLDSLCALKKSIRKVVLASSAAVYGNVENSVLSEAICPKPLSHYGCSKLAMEHMAQNYFEKLPIIITRPFNYTGVGHAEYFLIPKIVKAYQLGKKNIELGNLNVSREFNDVRDICKIYEDIIECSEYSKTINLCSGKAISLLQIIELMNQLAGYEINVVVNPDFVRENEIKDLSGDTSRLKKLVQLKFDYSIEDTLRWMFWSNNSGHFC